MILLCYCTPQPRNLLSRKAGGVVGGICLRSCIDLLSTYWQDLRVVTRGEPYDRLGRLSGKRLLAHQACESSAVACTPDVRMHLSSPLMADREALFTYCVHKVSAPNLA